MERRRRFFPEMSISSNRVWKSYCSTKPRMATTQTAPQLKCDTRYFGPLEYDPQAVLTFPQGIPAFEQQTRFLAIRQPMNEPLVFLQSLDDPQLCFATLPAVAACPGYRLRLTAEDL